MSNDNKTYQNWPDLVLYTKEFKEWIWKLFRKIQARIGHVEQDLAKVRDEVAVDYNLTQTGAGDEGLIYTLVEKNSGTAHGTIVIDPSTGVQLVLWENVHE